MLHPNLKEEKKLWKKGFKHVAGLDEAGRGPLAGPVVAAAIVINRPKIKFQKSLSRRQAGNLKNILKEVNDSKKLSPKKREEIFRGLTNSPFIEWGTGIVSEKTIDRINIFEATKLAMIKAVKKIKKIDYLILDGNFKLDLSLPQKSIIKADEKIISCAAASIMAKVVRDRIMAKYHQKFPKYLFLQHKGYPTDRHIRLLRKHGICKIHRKSFGPVRRLVSDKISKYQIPKPNT